MGVWSSVKKVLVVTKMDSEKKLLEFKEGLKSVGINEGKFILLVVVQSKKEKATLKEMGNVCFLAENDFNLFGKLKEEKVKEVLNQAFDLLIVNEDHIKKIEKVITRANVRFKVGVNKEITNEDINLAVTNKTPEHILNFVKQTLVKIK